MGPNAPESAVISLNLKLEKVPDNSIPIYLELLTELDLSLLKEVNHSELQRRMALEDTTLSFNP